MLRPVATTESIGLPRSQFDKRVAEILGRDAMHLIWLLLAFGCVIMFLAMCAADGDKRILWGLGLGLLGIITWKLGVAWGV